MNFDRIVKQAGNELGAQKVSEGVYSDGAGFIDTGSYAFNALLSGSIYGGLVSNKVTALAGEESTGKTYYALSIARHFLDMHKDGAVLYFESEGSLTTEIIESRGIDTERLYLMPVITIQEFRTQCKRLLDAYMEDDEEDRKPMFMILDSLGSLSTSKEIEDITEGNDTRDMTRAPLIRGTFRVLSLKLARANVALLVINHVYDVIGSYVPTKTMGGGRGLKYAASQIITLTKSMDRDKKQDNEVVGSIITCKTDKSRITKEKKTVETLINFENGLDRYYGLLDIAASAGLVEKLATQYQFSDGTKAFESSIKKNPEKYFSEDLLKKIDLACKAEFAYSGEFSEESDADETE